MELNNEAIKEVNIIKLKRILKIYMSFQMNHL